MDLSRGLLATAEFLVDAEVSLGPAGYALFSHLASLCADTLANLPEYGADLYRGRSRPMLFKMLNGHPDYETFNTVYRALDHRHAYDILKKHPEFVSPLGDNFCKLQDARHWADYSLDGHPDRDYPRPFTPQEARKFIDLASQAMEFVDDLSPDVKQRLAIALIVRRRRLVS